LDRGEIERRLMHKSMHADSPNLTPDMHLAPPTQNIVATSLLKMLSCLAHTPQVAVGAFVKNPNKHRGPTAQHMPPPA
jgi:hypothetical protein